eukprot:CAMPEP_0174377572 /NCGR_PEP_ID=MMETSP0811_2-20130205/121532_1 /TAXON_ID=73025 ORGANISM="Eutreptiella gymnastica-like, Strain CCMP1594" /NCGR_SAMPLE_ID=MMETSP0811_2 /ASSEMBLY_ACC=CAM_ASM_000667 /LENGTH=307 /DNA_ID=CAMNT_0015529621 /DNA_START=32 /DNA_END=956 /DNA_ORIENTATION=-
MATAQLYVEAPAKRMSLACVASGVLAGAAVVMVGLFIKDAAPATQLFAVPTTAAMTRIPMATGMQQRPSVVTYAIPDDAPPVDEAAIAEEAAEAVIEEEEEEERVNPKDLFDGQKTYYPKLADTQADKKLWYAIDATDLRLGRMATEIARILRGSNKPMYHPAMDIGDYVIVYNAEKVAVSGNKRTQKLYRRHTTGRPGSMKVETFDQLQARERQQEDTEAVQKDTTGRPGSMKVETFDQLQARVPERIVEQAVKGMLPKGILGRQLFRHLKVYKGPEHPHAAQNPIEFKFEGKLAKAAEPVTRGRP